MRMCVQRPFHSVITVSGQAVRRYLLPQRLTNRICVLEVVLQRPEIDRTVPRLGAASMSGAFSVASRQWCCLRRSKRHST